MGEILKIFLHLYSFMIFLSLIIHFLSLKHDPFIINYTLQYLALLTPIRW